MINIAIMGFGTVGGGVAEVLSENGKIINNRIGDTVNLKYILDLREFPGTPYEKMVVHDVNIILNDPEVSCVAEMMGGSHPAYEFTAAALRAGKNVVTSNKEVVAKYGQELLALAAENRVRYLFEASVGGGIPIIRAMCTSLSGENITEICGILNGTTNYILTKMTNTGMDFETLLKEAQANGYAEANPSADVDGVDACRKICILAALAYGELVPETGVHTVGIRNITQRDIARAAENGAKIKLIARAKRLSDGRLHLSVAPYEVVPSNPLCNIDDVYNGILVRTSATGDVMFYGRGAGSLPTAGAVMADIIDICTNLGNQPPQKLFRASTSGATDELSEAEAAETLKTLGRVVI